MLINSSLLILAVIQVLISGSQSKPHVIPSDRGMSNSPEWAEMWDLISGSQSKPHVIPSDRDECSSSSCITSYTRVCGSDGKTYRDTCELLRARCRNPSQNITTAYDGECNPECPPPWFLIGNQCFHIKSHWGSWTSARWGSWTSARDHCEELAPGADLAEPNDFKALHDYLKENTKHDYWYWLGGSDHLNGEGTWRWISGANITGWRDEPNDNGKGEDCLAMETNVSDILGPESSLNDRYCGEIGPFICERHINETKHF